jgi:hypothetical protein
MDDTHTIVLECIQPNNIDIENKIRERSYFKWLEATGGKPVDLKQSERFWLEAESEIK